MKQLKEERFWKVTVIENGQIIQTPNVSKRVPNSKSVPYSVRRKNKDEQPFMTTKLYKKRLREYREKLRYVKLDYKKCLWLVFTTKEILPLWDFHYQVNKILKYLKSKFNTKYIMGKESNEIGHHFHANVILIFPKNNPRIDILKYRNLFVKNLWKITKLEDVCLDDLGNITIRKCTKEDEIKLIKYMTKFEYKNIQAHDTTLSKFPSGAKIVTSSNNLEEYASYSFFTTQEQGNQIIIEAEQIGANIEYQTFMLDDKYHTRKIFIENANEIIEKVNGYQ